jgi:predicted transposase/invertase (TIGR01784 family)
LNEDLILHLEFQTDPDKHIPFRMLDYYVRLCKRYPNPNIQIQQKVIYLRQTASSLAYQTQFQRGVLSHAFEVIRLWELDPSQLQPFPALLPLQVLTQRSSSEEGLRAVARQIEQLSDLQLKRNLAAATAVLAGLALNQENIKNILGELNMRESVIYQEWRAEALQEGIQVGRQEGIQEGRKEGLNRQVNLIIRQLQRRVQPISPEQLDKIRALPITQVEALAEALLDFRSASDLSDWLNANG